MTRKASPVNIAAMQSRLTLSESVCFISSHPVSAKSACEDPFPQIFGNGAFRSHKRDSISVKGKTPAGPSAAKTKAPYMQSCTEAPIHSFPIRTLPPRRRVYRRCRNFTCSAQEIRQPDQTSVRGLSPPVWNRTTPQRLQRKRSRIITKTAPPGKKRSKNISAKPHPAAAGRIRGCRKSTATPDQFC